MCYRGEYFLHHELFMLLSGKSFGTGSILKGQFIWEKIFMLHYSSVKCEKTSVVLK
jgi:hypothetical protein